MSQRGGTTYSASLSGKGVPVSLNYSLNVNGGKQTNTFGVSIQLPGTEHFSNVRGSLSYNDRLGLSSDVSYNIGKGDAPKPMTEAERAQYNLLDDLIGGLGSVVSGIGRGVKSVWDGVFGGNDPYDNVLLANANGIIAFDGRLVSGSKQGGVNQNSKISDSFTNSSFLEEISQRFNNLLNGDGFRTDASVIQRAGEFGGEIGRIAKIGELGYELNANDAKNLSGYMFKKNFTYDSETGKYSTHVEINGKRISVEFTDDFADQWGVKGKTPTEVVNQHSEKTLGNLLYSAYQSEITEIVISGLGRPDDRRHANEVDFISVKFNGEASSTPLYGNQPNLKAPVQVQNFINNLYNNSLDSKKSQFFSIFGLNYNFQNSVDLVPNQLRSRNVEPNEILHSHHAHYGVWY